jgi:hypothetical protein
MYVWARFSSALIILFVVITSLPPNRLFCDVLLASPVQKYAFMVEFPGLM